MGQNNVLNTIKLVHRIANRFFKKFFLGFPNFFQILKVRIFESIFSLMLSLRLKIVLNRTKTLKRYCKATLNVFFKKKKLIMTKILST